MLIFGLVLNFWTFMGGAPIFAAFGFGSALALVFYYGMPISNVARIAFGAIDSFTLLACPLFILAGGLVVASGAARKLIDFTNALVGHIPGGLVVSTILFCTVFAALSGSGLAAIAAVGAIMYPELRKHGYSARLSAGAIASSGQLGILIPPSLFFIIIGMLMQVSAAVLFASGMVPGLIMSAGLCIVGIIQSIREHVPRVLPASWKTRGITFVKAIPAIGLAVIVLGGIYTGTFTPTEAATIACIYALFLGFVVYRKMTVKGVLKALNQGGLTAGAIYILIASVVLLTHIVSMSGFPAVMADFLMGTGMSGLAFICLFNFFVIAISFFIDMWALAFMLVPILMPVFNGFGLNLFWLGVTMCIGAQVGYMTPPMAVGLYFTSRVLDLPADEVIRGLVPFLIVMTLVIPIVIFFPETTLWLPRIMGMGVE